MHLQPGLALRFSAWHNFGHIQNIEKLFHYGCSNPRRNVLQGARGRHILIIPVPTAAAIRRCTVGPNTAMLSICEISSIFSRGDCNAGEYSKLTRVCQQPVIMKRKPFNNNRHASRYFHSKTQVLVRTENPCRTPRTLSRASFKAFDSSHPTRPTNYVLLSRETFQQLQAKCRSDIHQITAYQTLQTSPP